MVQLTLGSYSDQETSEVSRTYASVFNLSVVFSYKPRDFKDSFCFGLSVVRLNTTGIYPAPGAIIGLGLGPTGNPGGSTSPAPYATTNPSPHIDPGFGATIGPGHSTYLGPGSTTRPSHDMFA
ncbi:hypothetical protein VNO77_03519 [Canavalia gladiata]|uniref:Uncharacterized protein n=1 Tax=Canavalia gladiata TaxID=3824 RepID=A0AAN9MV09_CANGL